MSREAEQAPRSRLPSITRQPAIVPLVLTLLAAFVFGWLADRSLRSIIEQYALRTVSLAANARASTLRMKLGWQRDRAHGLLHVARLQCGRPGAEESACLRDVLAAFVLTEDAAGATLIWPGLPPVTAGSAPPSLAERPNDGRIARFERSADDAFYVLGASVGEAAIAIRFSSAKHLHPIFLNRDGLGDSGETFLADEEGFFVTPARYPCHAGVSHPIHATPMQRCLAGEDAATIAPDYRDVMVIHGFRKIRETGGCIMAHVDHTEAMAPARRLRSVIAVVTAGFVLTAAGWSLLYRRMFSRPLARLTARVRTIAAGDFEDGVPSGGPVEIRSLARAFASMVDSVKRSQAKLEEAVRVRDDFISLASHELRTPLTTLQLRLQVARRLLQRGPEALDKVASSIDVGCRQVEHMTHLVGEMLDITRIGQGRLALQRSDVDLREIVRRVLDDHAIELEQSRSTIDLQANGPVVGSWDGFRLEQVCVNLLTNALKYGQGQPIVVRVEEDGDVARLTVQDRGIGIAAEDQARVFRRFERAVPTRHFGGLGLGLTIAREIVEAHGGAIRVESASGAGATFTVELPCCAPEKGDRG